MKKKLIAAIIVIALLINVRVDGVFAEEQMPISMTDHICQEEINKNDNGFVLGNKTKIIFQDGLELFTDRGYYYVTQAGLYDDSRNIFLTDYFVSNLNGFGDFIYYTVNDYVKGNSRIESYNLLTSSKTVVYEHSSLMGQMYCVNNKYFMFLSDNKLCRYQPDMNLTAEEIVSENNDISNVEVFAFVPTAEGNILIGNRANDYSVYVNDFLYREHVYLVYEDAGYLFMTINGEDYQIKIEDLFSLFKKNKNQSVDSIFEVDCVTGEAISVNLIMDKDIAYTNQNESAFYDENTVLFSDEFEGKKGIDKKPYIDDSFLLEKVSFYPIVEADNVLYGDENNKIEVANNTFDKLDNYGLALATNNLAASVQEESSVPDTIVYYDDEWSENRISALKNFLQRITESMAETCEAKDKKTIRNILMNARRMMEIKWTFFGDHELKNKYSEVYDEIKGTKYLKSYRAYKKGQIFMGLPYQMHGTYVGYAGYTINNFLEKVGNKNSNFYTESYKNEYPEYGIDCSGFVGYSIQLGSKNSVKKLTGDEQSSDGHAVYVAKLTNLTDDSLSATLSSAKPGDFICKVTENNNNHCVLIAAIYREGTTVKGLVTLESRTLTTASRRNINVYTRTFSNTELEENSILTGLF